MSAAACISAAIWQLTKAAGWRASACGIGQTKKGEGGTAAGRNNNLRQSCQRANIKISITGVTVSWRWRQQMAGKRLQRRAAEKTGAPAVLGGRRLLLCTASTALQDITPGCSLSCSATWACGMVLRRIPLSHLLALSFLPGASCCAHFKKTYLDALLRAALSLPPAWRLDLRAGRAGAVWVTSNRNGELDIKLTGRGRAATFCLLPSSLL